MFDIKDVMEEVEMTYDFFGRKDGVPQSEWKLFIHGEDHSDLIPDEVRYHSAYGEDIRFERYSTSSEYSMFSGEGADVFYAEENEAWFSKILPKGKHELLGYVMYLAVRDYELRVLKRDYPPYFFACKDAFAKYTDDWRDTTRYDPRKDGFPPRKYKMWFCPNVYMQRGKWHGSSKCKNCDGRGRCNGVRKIKGYDWVDKQFLEPWKEILDSNPLFNGSGEV